MNALIQYQGNNPNKLMSATKLFVFLKESFDIQELEWKDAEVTKKGNIVTVNAKDISIDGNHDMTITDIREDVFFVDLENTFPTSMKPGEILATSFVENEQESHTVLCYGGMFG